MLAGLPLRGGRADHRPLPQPFDEAAVANATAAEEKAGTAAVPIWAGMRVPLPACQIVGVDNVQAESGPDVARAQSDVPASGAVNSVTMTRLPVRYTFGGDMTQTIVLPVAAEPLTPSVGGELPTARDPDRRRVLAPLYISMAALQALDLVSTHRALGAGGSEANPLMAPLVGSMGTLFAVKAGVSGAMFFAIERLRKQHGRAAILTLIGTNIGYAAVVSHNFALAAHAQGTR
jgi:Domain of unknown function (DUF5658)